MIKNIEVNIGAIWFDKDTKTLQVAALVPFSNNFCNWRRYVCQLVEDDGIYRRPYFMEQEKADCENYIDDEQEEYWNDSDIILFNRIIDLALEIVGTNTHSIDGFVLNDSVWWDDGNKEAKAVIR